MTDAFRAAIADALEREVSLDEFRDILIQFRGKGMSADSAYDVLESMRSGKDEPREDKILDVTDIVTGFCGPHYRVLSEGPVFRHPPVGRHDSRPQLAGALEHR